ncbi:hypothetical protein NP233_g3086 [Leucocoprinus birnbaumii]|uniref:Uncharacterized protein n=1 Tax=Leucocoprinus birnbaumii TaxID=56174 RepID=A0AAD5W3L4_9AGAR|nr:hypothetical protein NP233_g3086 [Leucocoprinus birnbaumii]
MDRNGDTPENHGINLRTDVKDMDHWRIATLGDCAGKSALVQREFDPTIEDITRKELVVDNRASCIEIIDTSGAGEYATLREQAIRAQGLILVYSITSRDTFERIEEYYRSMRRVTKDAGVPFLLVGNKSDLIYERRVTWDEGAALSDRLGCKFFETSAKSGENVDFIFSEAIRSLRAASPSVVHQSALRVMRLQKEIDGIYSELRKTAYGQTVQAKLYEASNEQNQILGPLLAQANSKDLERGEKEELEERIKDEYILCLREFRGYFAEVKAMGIQIGPHIREFYGFPEPERISDKHSAGGVEIVASMKERPITSAFIMGSFLSTPSDQLDETVQDTPSEWDVFATRAILLERFPPELVDEIIHKANYWPVIHGSCHSHFQVHSGVDDSYCCLITPPIPSAKRLVKTRLLSEDQPLLDDVEIDVRRQIQSITFEFTSRDQGWGGDPGLKGPYAGSWTWFEAEIWRPIETDNRNELEVGSSISSTARIKPMMESPTDEALLAAGYIRVKPPDAADTHFPSAWLIQRNMRASDIFQIHQVIWTSDGFLGYDCQEYDDLGDIDIFTSTLSPSLIKISSNREQNLILDSKTVDIHGCGNGLDFIGSLQPGDRIVVNARARFPGWCNRIHGNMTVNVMYRV